MTPHPRPGIRHAATCPYVKDNTPCANREFFASRAEAEAWRCREHRVGKVQENKPYFGASTA